jgi:hypothetical protein
MDSLPADAGQGPAAVLARFRRESYNCLTARGNEIFELADAVLCASGPVRDLAGLSLMPEHQRGHGALYDAVNQGRTDIGRLRRALAGLPLPPACAAGSRSRPAKTGITVGPDINSQPATTSKTRDQPGISSPLRSSAARIRLSHSVPSWRPFGSWSPRSQRHVAIIASTRIRHSRSKS